MKSAILTAALLLFCLVRTATAYAEINVDTESLRLTFDRQASLLRAEACFPSCDAENAQTRVLSSDQFSMLTFHTVPDNEFRFEQSHQDSQTTLNWFDTSGRLVSTWTIPDKGWLLSYRSPHDTSITLYSGEDFRPAPSSGFGYLLEQTRYLVFDEGNVESIALDETEEIARTSNGWLGFRNRFWTVMLKPEGQFSVRPKTGESVVDARLELMRMDTRTDFDLYLGPIEPSALSNSAPELESLMYSGLWFWLRWICQALYFLLNGIFMLIPNWGLAVMALSVAVGVLMRPLSTIADRLQDQVHETDARLGPTIASIKKNYRGAEQSEKILAMYKSEKVHPLYSLKSLVGVFVVIPVFIGAFDMLAENIHLSGESFMWIADLSHPDAFMLLPFRLPFFGEYLNLLPFIMTGFSFVASKLHSHPAMDAAQRRKHSRNLLMMAVGFLVLFYTFPAGMVLYWTTNNLISVIKTLWKKRKLVTA